MKITVFGGTGRIGTLLVPLLRVHGHEVTIASTRSGVDAYTGHGIQEALEWAHAVIDVLDTRDFTRAGEFFKTTTANLLAASREAAVSHYVALSIVGVQEITGSAYYDAKKAQEDLIAASGLPFTIVEATQFYEFAETIAAINTVDEEVHSTQVLVQPIAARDVALQLARVATGNPANGTMQVAGPERMTLAAFLGAWLAATGDTRTLVLDPGFTYSATEVGEASLVPSGGAQIARTRFSEWLRPEGADPAQDLA